MDLGTPHSKVGLCGGCFPDWGVHPVDPNYKRGTRGQPPNRIEVANETGYTHTVSQIFLSSLFAQGLPPTAPEANPPSEPTQESECTTGTKKWHNGSSQGRDTPVLVPLAVAM